MYLEFFILISDYFKTLKLRLVIYEIIIPLLFSLFVFYILKTGKDTNICNSFKDNSLTLLGVLLGFSITVITILTTGSSKNLQLIQSKETKHKIGGKPVTLFDLLLINFTYSVVIEVIVIMALLVYPIILKNIVFSTTTKYVIFSLISGIVIHILLLTMRNLTDFYLILIKK